MLKIQWNSDLWFIKDHSPPLYKELILWKGIIQVGIKFWSPTKWKNLSKTVKKTEKTCQLIQPQAAQVIGGISNPLLSLIAFLPKITEFKTGAAWAVGNQAYPGYCIHNSFLPEFFDLYTFYFLSCRELWIT